MVGGIDHKGSAGAKRIWVARAIGRPRNDHPKKGQPTYDHQHAAHLFFPGTAAAWYPTVFEVAIACRRSKAKPARRNTKPPSGERGAKQALSPTLQPSRNSRHQV